MKKASELMKKFTTDLEDFRNLTVSYDQTVSRKILTQSRKPARISMKLSTISSAR
jgi:hypothetical protein